MPEVGKRALVAVSAIAVLAAPAAAFAQTAADIRKAYEAKDMATLKKLADFWNTGFDATSLPDNPGVYLSAGPYVLTAYEEVSQMTFEINELYNWGPKPKVDGEAGK